MKRRIRINYDNLQPMDRVDCAGRGVSATVTRTVTAGKEYADCYGIAVHTACVVDFAGQKMLIEMGPGGIRRVDFLRYEFEMSRRWILDIRRHPVFDNADIREMAQAELIHRWRQHVEKKRRIPYGWGDLLTFVFPTWRDDPRRTICSELYVEATKKWIPDYDPRIKI
jgi:hypothetical protein